MPPSSLFAYLRPGHGKRNASSPSLLTLTREAPAGESHGAEHGPHASSPTADAAEQAATGPPVSPAAPQLPPIPRVASAIQSPEHHEEDKASPRPPSEPSPEVPTPMLGDVRPPTRPSSSDPAPSPSLRAASDATPESQARTPPAPSPSFLSLPSLVSSGYASASRSQTSLMSGRSERRAPTPKMASTPTAAPQKSSKSRLSLRNPMSIFHRRRSGDTIENLSEESLISRRSPSLVPPLPDNYDPSIRGRIVHDFSAPRPNRQPSYHEYSGDRDTSPGRVSPQKIERQHTPVFRENFDDDTSYEQTQAAIRAEQLANSSFVARNSYHPPGPEPSPPKESPPPEAQYAFIPPPPDAPVEFETTLLSPVLEATSPTDGTPEGTPQPSKSIKSPPATRSRVTSVTENTFVAGALLAHHPSSSSRFSFQIGGGDSAAQEKIMEERHIQKEAEKKSKEAHLSKASMEDEYDGYGMDDYDMDDGMEEDIPMVGEDHDFGAQAVTPGMSAFDFSNLSIQGTNMGLMTPLGMYGQLQNPVDAHGVPIGFAISGDSGQGADCGGGQAGLQEVEGHTPSDMHAPPSQDNALQFMDPNGLGLLHSTAIPGNTASNGLEDDLYFDDGIIDELGEVGESTFDENIFDDPSGPLFDRKVKSPTTEDRPGTLHTQPPEFPRPEAGYEEGEDESAQLPEGEISSLGRMPSLANQRPSGQISNMEAFSSALTEALHKAEAEGRFMRKLSISTEHSANDNSSFFSNSRPSLAPDDSRVSQETTGFQPDDEMLGMGSSFMDDYECSDFDSALEDDPMIAAANAEALANDYEGFYGQEFGFYANAQGESWNAYGGYFGNPSSLGRTKSGRNAVVEPSLTPITERSEYSTRNSFVSINHFRDSQLSLQSPGLAQLRMSPYGFPEDDDMSLEGLRRLRGKTFGGSSVSLGSAGGGANSPRTSSPMGMQYVPRNASPMANHPVFTSSGFPSSDGPVVSGDDEFGGEDGFDQDALDAINAQPLDDGSGEDADEAASASAEQTKHPRATSPMLIDSASDALPTDITGTHLTTTSSPPTQAGHTKPLGPTMLPASDPHFGISPPQRTQLEPLTLMTNLHSYPLPPPHPHDVLNSRSPSSPGAGALHPGFENVAPLSVSPSSSFLPVSPSTSALALATPMITTAPLQPTYPLPPLLARAPALVPVSSTTPSISKRQSLGLITPSPTSPSPTMGHALSPTSSYNTTAGASLPNPYYPLGSVHAGSSTTVDSTASGGSPGSGGGKPGMHARRGSGFANSYVRESDEMGGDRWVLERRRTAESGEMELVGREVVEGGRI